MPQQSIGTNPTQATKSETVSICFLTSIIDNNISLVINIIHIHMQCKSLYINEHLLSKYLVIVHIRTSFCIVCCTKSNLCNIFFYLDYCYKYGRCKEKCIANLSLHITNS